MAPNFQRDGSRGRDLREPRKRPPSWNSRLCCSDTSRSFSWGSLTRRWIWSLLEELLRDICLMESRLHEQIHPDKTMEKSSSSRQVAAALEVFHTWKPFLNQSSWKLKSVSKQLLSVFSGNFTSLRKNRMNTNHSTRVSSWLFKTFHRGLDEIWRNVLQFTFFNSHHSGFLMFVHFLLFIQQLWTFSLNSSGFSYIFSNLNYKIWLYIMDVSVFLDTKTTSIHSWKLKTSLLFKVFLLLCL